MKKLFVLVLVLAISSMATAASVDLQIIAGPTPGDYEGIPSYNPSDTITIALVSSGMGTEPWEVIGLMVVGDMTTTGGGTASGVGFNAEWDATQYNIVNSATLLIEDIQGSVSGASNGIGNGDLFWFDFHVPELPYSTIITIDATGQTWKDLWNDPLTMTYGGALEIHVVPEPITIALLGLGGLFLRRRK